MKKFTKTQLLVACSTVIAIASMFVFRWFEQNGAPATDGHNYLWEKLVVATTTIPSIIFALLEPRAPWRWPLFIGYVHYFSGFFIIDTWGQVPPLELIFITILALPGIAMAYLASYVAKKI